jgi:hypothetical protein
MLERAGVLVRTTSDNRKTRKQLKSLPDFQIRLDSWSPGIWLSVEVKDGNDWKWSSESQEQAYYDKKLLCWFWLEDCERWINENCVK